MPAIRGLTRFLTMAEVAETAKTAWYVIIDCVAIFYEEGELRRRALSQQE